MGKIIDWKRKGNVVRYYIGEDDLGDWYGDDWDDVPYEHNADEVYDEFVIGYKDVAYPFDSIVLEPCDGVTNSVYSKEDMVARRVPILVVADGNDDYYPYDDDFAYINGLDGIERIYMGDTIDDDSTHLGNADNHKHNGE